MSPERFMRPPKSAVYRYGVAVLTVALALGIKLVLLQFKVTFPLSSSFLAAIAITFWFAGTGPGILALLLSSFAFGFIVVPYQIKMLEGAAHEEMPANFISTLPYLAYFGLVALLVSWFSASRREAERQLSLARAQLEAKVEARTAELRKTDEELHAEVLERRQAEDALHKAQAELTHVARVTTMGELVASIAHEVNQPLGAIVTNGHACVRLLSSETPDIDKSLEVVRRMIADGMRASEVIKRIRGLLHKTPSERALLNINETIQEVLVLVSRDLLRSHIKVSLELAKNLPPVIGDRVQLQQVILNLILNAKDAMTIVTKDSRKLLIRSRESRSGDIVVAVRDSGMGIDPAVVERIFDPFFTTKAEGMGLGLSISRTIIEAHEGRLWATQNEDSGSTIQFTLPARTD